MAEIIFPNGSKLSDLLPYTGGTLTSTLITKEVYPVTSDTYLLGNTTHFWAGLYVDGISITDTSHTIANVTGDMKFSIPSGKKFIFQVG